MRAFFSTFLVWLLTATQARAAVDTEQLVNDLYKDRPQLQIQIPGFEGFSKPIAEQVGTQTTLSIPYLAEYISAFFRFAIGASAILAAAMITIGGFKWTMSRGEKVEIDNAKKRISGGVTGMLLLLSSYIILSAINPALVNLPALRVRYIERVNLLDETEVGEATSEDAGVTNITQGQRYSSSVKVCDTIASCKTLCEKPPEEWPDSNPKVVPPSSVFPISGTGIDTQGARSATRATITALKQAAAFAREKKPSYSLLVTSAYRPLANQISLACDDIARNKGVNLGKKIAWPGISNHGIGSALDVVLMDGTTQVTCAGVTKCNMKDTRWKAGSEVLLEIMDKAGFKRLNNEIWHYEFSTSGASLCDKATCKHPPNM